MSGAPGASRQALAAGVACYVIWGAIPILFIATARSGASPWEIVAERAVWSAPWAAALVLAARQGRQVLKALASPRTVGALAVSAAAIGAGWIVYVWAATRGRNIEASLGYYITPLLNMAAGILFFGERIEALGAAAIGLTAIGVALQAWALGRMPWIALFLATTFWIYGLIRRQVWVEAQTGLLVECLLMAFPGLAATLWLTAHHTTVFGHGLVPTLLLLSTGPATVAPLALFAWTLRRLPLQWVGFLQLIGPTMGFAVGVATGEVLTPLRLVSFAFIWAGVAAFLASATRRARKLQIA